MREKPQNPCPDHHMSLKEIEAHFRRREAERLEGLSRRDFIRAASFAALSAGVLASGVGGVAEKLMPAAAAAEPPTPTSTVVRVAHPSAVLNGKPDAEIVDRMVNRAVCLLTGKKEPADAWKEVFSPKDVVGIAVNGIAGPGLSSNRELVDAICRSLTKIGVPENSIIVWGSTGGRVENCGFKKNMSDTGVRACNAPDVGYSEPYELKQYGQSTRVTKIVTEQITALINVPVLKDHSGSGVTFALKNIALGATNNPGALHANFSLSIPEVNAIDVVRKKHRLVLGDALLACYNAGPGRNPKFVWEEKAVMAAFDPVAVDVVALSIIEARRKDNGLGPIGKRADHVEASARFGLGNADPAKIKLFSEDLT